ncbi:MAG: N-acetylmuramoyl-L-alanine amidase [Clostridia bacterium]|nr:N-acetylmuramoyl-L-alanine amidase [Clostridia bacterium]
MSDSSLVCYTKISPNSTNPRKGKISKITIHHMAGNLSVERCGQVFADPQRKASANYGIGSDGRIALYVSEKNRAWTSSSAENDNVAVTIEVANDVTGADWHVSDKAMASLIDLCADICTRNGIKRLEFTGNKSGNLTMHKYFAPTACPGPYLESKFSYIANEVNKRLGENGTSLSRDLGILAKHGVINSPSYWKTKASGVKYLPELIHKMADKLERRE